MSRQAEAVKWKLRVVLSETHGTSLGASRGAGIERGLDLPTGSGARPLARSLRRLGTGAAGAFNRRRGHLFQIRYASSVVEEAPGFRELRCALHLHPFRSGIVQERRAAVGVIPSRARIDHRIKERPRWSVEADLFPSGFPKTSFPVDSHLRCSIVNLPSRLPPYHVAVLVALRVGRH